MNVLRIRNEMRSGKTIFDLPLRVTFYARVSTEKTNRSIVWKTKFNIILS